MALDVDDIGGDKRFVEGKLGNIEDHGQPSVEIDSIQDTDNDYDNYLIGDYKSIEKDNEAEKGEDVGDAPKNEMSVDDVGDDDTQSEMSVNDFGDDPQYELFLSSLKEDGSSYVLQVDNKNGLTMSIKYEEVESDDEFEYNIQTKQKRVTNKELEVQEALDSLSKTWQRASEFKKDLLFEPIDSIPSPESFLNELECGNTCLSDNPRKHDMQSGSRKRLLVMKKSRKVTDGKKIKTAENSKPDKDYALFCKNLRCDGFNVVFQFGNGLHVVYEGQDLQNLKTDNGKASMKEKSKLQESSESVEGDTNCQSLGSPRRNKHSTFRVRIMRILRKPYDKEEHERLMHEITLQKPQSRHIDLRSGGVVFYDTSKKGKSYLDHHRDLKEKVKAAAKDDHKQLNLLRGFFFWLQNLTRDDSFIPWNDKECLAV